MNNVDKANQVSSQETNRCTSTIKYHKRSYLQSINVCWYVADQLAAHRLVQTCVCTLPHHIQYRTAPVLCGNTSEVPLIRSLRKTNMTSSARDIPSCVID